MKIVVGKFVQKLVFDRSSPGALRSNTNGNYSAYKLFELLFVNNPKDTFYLVGDNDFEGESTSYSNVKNVGGLSVAEQVKLKADAAIILAGLLDEEGDAIVDYLNASGVPWVLVADDPRCLQCVALCGKLINKPKFIASQANELITFADGTRMNANYFAIERASCFGYELGSWRSYKKESKLVVLANEVDGFNRIGIVKESVRGCPVPVEVYGRIAKSIADGVIVPERDGFIFKGEVPYDVAQDKLKSALYTYLVPVKPGWATSKYVEAIMCGALPFMHESYASKAIGMRENDFAFFDDIALRVNCDISLSILLKSFGCYEALSKSLGFAASRKFWPLYIGELEKRIIAPYVDGSLLSARLKNILRSCELSGRF